MGTTCIPCRAADADHDGMADDWEAEHGVTDPTADPDLDLLSNVREFSERGPAVRPGYGQRRSGRWFRGRFHRHGGLEPRHPMAAASGMARSGPWAPIRWIRRTRIPSAASMIFPRTSRWCDPFGSPGAQSVQRQGGHSLCPGASVPGAVGDIRHSRPPVRQLVNEDRPVGLATRRSGRGSRRHGRAMAGAGVTSCASGPTRTVPVTQDDVDQ